MGKKIAYIFFRINIGLMKIMPFWLLYRFSDLIFLVMAYMIQYRKSIIDKNLKKCFPDKSKAERYQIKMKFYRNLSDLLVESVKGYSMNSKQILKRYKAYHSEIVDEYYKQGKSVIILTGHLANWEWAAAAISNFYKHKPIALYKPLSNKYIDRFVRTGRAHLGVELASIYQTSFYFSKTWDTPVAFYMLADQYAPKLERQIKVNFFNSVTPFLDGPEKYFRKHNLAVVYTEIKREKRGYYSLTTTDIASGSEGLKINELTQIYADLLEKTIVAQPEDWIWSHKRWKRELYDF